MSEEPQSKFQQKVTESLNDVFDKVIVDRKKYYVENQDKIPQRSDIESLINRFANINAMIAGGAGLVPGPWGMLAAVPEIMAVISNQSKMIFDICVALGKHKHIRSELVVGILMTGMGAGSGSLIAVQGGKLLVRRASLRVMQKIIAMLGGKVTQQLLKSMVGKWLPVVGAAAMAAWARYSTKKLGEQAFELLSKEIVDTGEMLSDEGEGPVSAYPDARPVTPQTTQPAMAQAADGQAASSRSLLEFTKIRVLINVMLADQEVAPEEVAYIQGLIEAAEVSPAEREVLSQMVAARRRVDVDYSVFQQSPDDQIGLLFAMTALARRDGNIHLAERMYIKMVGKRLGFADADIDAAFEAEMPKASATMSPVQVPWAVVGTVHDPELGVPVELVVSGSAVVVGGWSEALSWVEAQAGRLALDALARSPMSVTVAWTQADQLARSLQEQLDNLLRPHQMHVLAVSAVEIKITPRGMEALQRAGVGG